jgi:hypothetical protein
VLEGHTPFVVLSDLKAETIRQLVHAFPSWVEHSHGELTDLAIKREWEALCALHPGRRVHVWSLDHRLRACDRPPQLDV